MFRRVVLGERKSWFINIGIKNRALSEVEGGDNHGRKRITFKAVNSAVLFETFHFEDDSILF